MRETVTRYFCAGDTSARFAYFKNRLGYSIERHRCSISVHFLAGTGTASIRVKDINDMPPQFTKDEWFTEVDETEGPDLPEMPILTVTVHDEDETNKFQYKVLKSSYVRDPKSIFEIEH